MHYTGARRWQIDTQYDPPTLVSDTIRPFFIDIVEEGMSLAKIRCVIRRPVWDAFPEELKVVAVAVAFDMWSYMFASQLAEAGVVQNQPKVGTILQNVEQIVRSLLENPTYDNLRVAQGKYGYHVQETVWELRLPPELRLELFFPDIFKPQSILWESHIAETIERYAQWEHNRKTQNDDWQLIPFRVFSFDLDNLNKSLNFYRKYFDIWWADVQSVWAWQSEQEAPETKPTVGTRRWQIDHGYVPPQPLAGSGVRPPIRTKVVHRSSVREPFIGWDLSRNLWVGMEPEFKLICIGVAFDIYSHIQSTVLMQEIGKFGLEPTTYSIPVQQSQPQSIYVEAEMRIREQEEAIKKLIQQPSLENLVLVARRLIGMYAFTSELDITTRWLWPTGVLSIFVENAASRVSLPGDILNWHVALEMIIGELIQTYAAYEYHKQFSLENYRRPFLQVGDESENLEDVQHDSNFMNHYFDIWWGDVQTVWAWKSLREVPEV